MNGENYYCVCVGNSEIQYSDLEANQIIKSFRSYEVKTEVKEPVNLIDNKAQLINDINTNKIIPLKNYYQPLDDDEIHLEFTNEDVDYERQNRNVVISPPKIKKFFKNYTMKVSKEKRGKVVIKTDSKVKCDIVRRDQYDLDNPIFDKYFERRRNTMREEHITVKKFTNKVQSLGIFCGDFRSKIINLGHQTVDVDPCHFIDKGCSSNFHKFLSKMVKEKPTVKKSQVLLLYYKDISKLWAKYGWFWHNQNILCNSDYSSLYIFDDI